MRQLQKFPDNHSLKEACQEKGIEISSDIPDTLRRVLLKYQKVFELPKGLPPSRMCDHRIPLQPNSNPVKVRPYRYPHSQKTEIENMVEQMLKEGLIEPNNSPFSSLVILVKKKMEPGDFAQITGL